MAYNQPHPGQSDKRGVMRRLGVYLVGVAIGLMALGMFNAAKQRARQSQPPQPQASPPQPQPAPATNPAPSTGESAP